VYNFDSYGANAPFYTTGGIMVIQLTILSILLISTCCVIVMIYKLVRQPQVRVSTSDFIKLAISGVLAFISDTIGIGSFAANIALAKFLGTFQDEELPAVNNGAQVIPGTFESLFFMQAIQVDLTTLLTLVAGTCIGGIIGGNIVTRLSKQAIRITMLCCFLLIIALLLCEKLGFMPVGGELLALHSWKLVFGFFAMIVCGSLTCAGIGLFALVQGVLFLMGVSPAIAFPIMTTAGAMQQPMTTLVFLKQGKIPLKKTFILSLFGCLGVGIALPIVSHMSTPLLHSLLLLIMLYNFMAIGRTYLRSRHPTPFLAT
jgi:uncharacterized membrane protein YfcA